MVCSLLGPKRLSPGAPAPFPSPPHIQVSFGCGHPQAPRFLVPSLLGGQPHQDRSASHAEACSPAPAPRHHPVVISLTERPGEPYLHGAGGQGRCSHQCRWEAQADPRLPNLRRPPDLPAGEPSPRPALGGALGPRWGGEILSLQPPPLGLSPHPALLRAKTPGTGGGGWWAVYQLGPFGGGPMNGPPGAFRGTPATADQLEGKGWGEMEGGAGLRRPHSFPN